MSLYSNSKSIRIDVVATYSRNSIWYFIVRPISACTGIALAVGALAPAPSLLVGGGGGGGGGGAPRHVPPVPPWFLSLQVSLDEVAQVEGSDCGCDTIPQSFPLPLIPLVPLPSLLPPVWPLPLPLPWPLLLTSDSLLMLLSLEVSLEELTVTEGSDSGFS